MALFSHVSQNDDAPLKSAQAIAALAIQSKSKVEFKYRREGKDEVVLVLTPPEAQALKENSKNLEHLARDQRERRLPKPVDRLRIASASQSVEAEDALRDKLSALPVAYGELQIDSQTRDLIVALVQALIAQGGTERVEELAARLDADGNHAASTFLRRLIPPASGGRGLVPAYR